MSSWLRSLFGGGSSKQAKLQEKLTAKYGLESGGCSRLESSGRPLGLWGLGGQTRAPCVAQPPATAGPLLSG